MKIKLKCFSALLMAAISIFACSKDNESNAPSLKLDPSSPLVLDFSYSNNPTPQTITLITNVEWDATSVDDWVIINKSESSFSVTLTPSLFIDRRSTILITGADGVKPIEIPVHQFGITPTLAFDQTKLEFEKYGDYSQRFEVYANQQSWVVSSNQNWVKVVRKSFTVEVTCKDNYTTSPREAEITVTLGPITLVMPVTQEAGSQPGGATFDNFFGIYTVTGTPVWNELSTSNTWESRVEQYPTTAIQYLTSTNFANMNTNVYLHFINGRVTFVATVIANTPNGYSMQVPCYIDPETQSLAFIDNRLELEWNPETKKLTFPTKTAQGYEILWGIHEFNSLTDEWIGALTQLYSNLEYTQTSNILIDSF